MAAVARMRVEELRRLLRSEGFDALFAANPEGMFAFASDGSFVAGNPAMLAKFGYTLDKVQRLRFEEFFHPEDSPRVRDEFAATVGGEVRQYVATGVSHDGTTVRCRITQVPLVYAEQTLAVVGFAADLARLESTIATDLDGARRSEALLSAVLGSITDGFLFVDKHFRVTYLNSAAEKIMQVTSSEFLGKVLWDVFPEARGSEFGIAYLRAVAEQKTVTLRDYSPELEAWFDVTAYPTSEGLAVYFRDVSESERGRKERVEQDAELAMQSAMLDTARDAIIVRGLDGNIRYWNKAASRIYGWPHEDVIGLLARDVLYAAPTQFDLAHESTMRDGHWSGELSQVTKSGEEITVESSWTLVRDRDGRPESIFAVNTDVTQKRRSEDQALRAQRMESLGTLASGIAHDLNNVLTPILMAVQLLAPGEEDPRRRQILQSTELAVKRGADMIRQVLSFASGVNVRRVPVDLCAVIGELQAICAETIPKDISATFEVDDDLWQTSGDATQLLQVLMNLVTNARDAMPAGGVIKVRARNVTLTDVYASVSHIADRGNYVMVEVQDSGSGIPSTVLDKIFEPFFTTKPTGSGTGLGLSTSLAIIRGHGGYMQAYSEPGHGSVLRLHLPATGKRGAATGADTRIEELPRGDGELILVVDDETAIRVLTRQTLDTYGYKTVVASNGAEAIQYVESGPSRVALVLTDMAMPVLDGAATAKYLLQHHPKIPVIAASGLSANGDVARSRSSGIRKFLAKPYTTAELLHAIRGTLHPEEGDESDR